MRASLLALAKSIYIKHLMTAGLEGNSDFCFPIHTLLEDTGFPTIGEL